MKQNKTIQINFPYVCNNKYLQTNIILIMVIFGGIFYYVSFFALLKIFLHLLASINLVITVG